MSIRTIIEINHDQIHSLARMSHDELKDLLFRKAVNCNEHLHDKKGCRHQSGITTLAQRHHSTSVELRIDGFLSYSE